MHCRVVNCCFCCSIRWGIIVFAYINVLMLMFAVACLVLTTDIHQRKIVGEDSSLEVITCTVLYAILGMGVLLNVLLLVAGYQKDITMLKLYNYYAVATMVVALVPIIILCTKMRFTEVSATVFAIATNCYVILLVRSEILKLKQKQILRRDPPHTSNEHIIVVPDNVTLIY